MNVTYYTQGRELTGFDITLTKGTTIIDELKLPSVVDGKPISHIATTIRKAFFKLKEKGISEIKNVVIEEGITSVCREAFARIWIRINRVCWPASCTVIPDYCFYNSHIESITGTGSVTIIGTGAFSATHVKIFEWPSLCKEIPDDCFAVSSLERITGIDMAMVKNIGLEAFLGTKLQTFMWSPKCKSIPKGCFMGCRKLEQIDGLEGVTDIGKKAFLGTAIKVFRWPENVSATGIVSFLDCCDNLEEIRFEGTGIKDIDLKYFLSLKSIKKIDLSQLGAVNLRGTDIPECAEIKKKLLLPYYVTEIN